MKHVMLSLLSLFGGLALFLSSFFVQSITHSLLFMALSILLLLLTIGILSSEGSQTEVDPQKSKNLY